MALHNKEIRGGQQMFDKVVEVVLLCCFAVLLVLLIICLVALKTTPGPAPAKVFLAASCFIGIGDIIVAFVVIMRDLSA